MARIVERLGGLIFLAAFFSSCSSTPAELVAKHTKRGDEYVAQGKFNEAVIEYKNAVKAGPNDSALRLKLAMAALEAKDIRTAKVNELECVLFFPAEENEKKTNQ